MSDHVPSSAELARLADKYAKLYELRKQHAAGMAVPTDGTLRDLARAFPGALRELDQLPLDEIERRQTALSLAAEGAELEAWMVWIHGYHGALRASLYVKARARKGVASTAYQALAEQASTHARYPVDVAFVSSLLERGRCRITSVAIELVAERAQVDAAVIRATLLPRAAR